MVFFVSCHFNLKISAISPLLQSDSVHTFSYYAAEAAKGAPQDHRDVTAGTGCV